MSADKAVLEALARIEHKVDLCLKMATMLFNTGGGPPVLDHPMMTDPEHLCPVCGQHPKYNIDIFHSVVTRSCGCGSGKMSFDLNLMAPQPTNARRSNDGDQREDNGSPEPSSGGSRVAVRPGGSIQGR